MPTPLFCSEIKRPKSVKLFNKAKSTRRIDLTTLKVGFWYKWRFRFRTLFYKIKPQPSAAKISSNQIRQLGPLQPNFRVGHLWNLPIILIKTNVWKTKIFTNPAKKSWDAVWIFERSEVRKKTVGPIFGSEFLSGWVCRGILSWRRRHFGCISPASAPVKGFRFWSLSPFAGIMASCSMLDLWENERKMLHF